MEKTRRLTIPLIGDVPLQHLLCPVHSANKRCPSHPAGGVPSTPLLNSTPVLRSALCASIITRTFPGKLPLHANRGYQGAREIALATNISCSKHLRLLCSWAHMSGLSTLVCTSFSYKRGGTQRYNSSSLRPSSGSQVHTSSQAQYNTQWSRVLCSGGPNHSKPLRVLMCSSPNLVTGKTLRPLLILGFRAGAFRHPAGDFLSDIWRTR
jgi:hypothetical protein